MCVDCHVYIFWVTDLIMMVTEKCYFKLLDRPPTSVCGRSAFIRALINNYVKMKRCLVINLKLLNQDGQDHGAMNSKGNSKKLIPNMFSSCSFFFLSSTKRTLTPCWLCFVSMANNLVAYPDKSSSRMSKWNTQLTFGSTHLSTFTWLFVGKCWLKIKCEKSHSKLKDVNV